MIPRESMRNRSNQALSRDKAYYHTLVGGRTPYYGGYPGATAGHATSTELTEANHKILHAMHQHLLKVDPAINHLIATRYRDQHDCIAAHSDKTPDLVPNSLIYDMSFGATRRMVFKNQDKTIVHTLEMKHGSLFILGPRTNALYTHEIIKESVPCPARISLIYRTAATTLSPAQQATLRRKYDDQLAAQINNPPAMRK